MADLKYTVATEACADRAAVGDALNAVLNSMNAGIQSLKDQMCQDKIDAKNERIAALENQLNMGELNQYRIWLAQYASQATYGGKYDMWQYTSKGSVSGISGNVDMNINLLGY